MKTVFFAILAIFPLLASASILARAPQQNGACSNRCYNEYTLKAKQVTPKRYKCESLFALFGVLHAH